MIPVSKPALNDWLVSIEDKAASTLGRRQTEARAAYVSSSGANLPVSNYYYVNRSWNWSTDRSVNYHYETPKTEAERKEEQEAKTRKLAAGAGIAVLLASVGFLAHAKNNYTTGRIAEDRSLRMRDYFNSLVIGAAVSQSPVGAIYQEIVQVAEADRTIESMKVDKYAKYFFTAVLGIFGGACLVLGGLSVLPAAFMTVGAITTIAAATFGVYNLVDHWNDERAQRPHAETIARLVPNIRYNLWLQFNAMNWATCQPLPAPTTYVHQDQPPAYWQMMA